MFEQIHNSSFPPGLIPRPADSKRKVQIPGTVSVRIASVLIFLLAPIVGISQGAWVKQQTGTLAWLHAIYFVGETGWAGGANGTILGTHDGGETWAQLPKPTQDSIRDIYFSDQKNGWMLCDRDQFKLKSATEIPSYLLRTNDGGRSWRRIEISGNDGQAKLVRFAFTRDGGAWLLGEAGTLLKSVDNGETWKRQPLSTKFLLLSADFLSPDLGWIVGAGVTIMQTTDGGNTWRSDSIAERVTRGRFNSAAFVDPKFGWVVGDAGRVYATVDGGRTWLRQQSNVDVELHDVKFLDASEGWIAGSDGTLMHTTDGGMHWTREPTGIRHPLERLYVAASDKLWAVGFGGTILSFDPNAAQPRIR
jgi:photosystem II stability/assembly factor-like uncharacterized protein